MVEITLRATCREIELPSNINQVIDRGTLSVINIYS